MPESEEMIVSFPHSLLERANGLAAHREPLNNLISEAIEREV